MSAPWISDAAVIEWLLKSTALIALAWIAAIGARKFNGSAALRHLLWLSALAGAVSLPLLAALTPVRFAVLPTFYEQTAVGKSGIALPGGWTPSDLIFAAYACVAALLLSRIAFGHRRLNVVWRQALEVESIQAQCDALAASVGLERCVAVRLADHASAPMTWGFMRPKVLLPAAAIGWPPAERRLVLMHELAHVARADSFTQVLASIAVALAWFQPALWFASARLRYEQEHACDDRVLLAGVSPAAYARTLLDVAAGRLAYAAPAAVMMAAPSQLEERLKAIVAGRPRVLSLTSGAVAMAGACVALGAAAIFAPAQPAAQTLRASATAPIASSPGVASALPNTSAPTALAVGPVRTATVPHTRRVGATPPVPATPVGVPQTAPVAPPVVAVAAVPLVAPIPPTPPTPVVAPVPPTPPVPVVHHGVGTAQSP